MVKVEFDPMRDKLIVTISSGNVEVVYDAPQATVKDVTPDGKPLIILAA